jgi:glycosyltransferase involved in cell wall biosynthesis
VFPENFNWITRRYRQRKWKRLAHSADVVIAGSVFMAREFSRLWGIDRNNISVLPAPILPLPTRPASPRRDRPYFIYPANFYAHKNHITLVRAFAKAGLTSHTLILTGSGPEFPRVDQEVSRLGLQDRVELPGKIDYADLGSLIRGSEAVVMPTTYEAGSFPILEAASFGAKVIASDIPPFHEIEYSNLIIYGIAKDVDSLSRALLEAGASESTPTTCSITAFDLGSQLSFFAQGLDEAYTIALAGAPT